MRHTASLGEDGRATMDGIQRRTVTPGCLPADIAKAIEACCKDLGRRAALKELSGDLEKDREQERLTQLKDMEAEVSKYKVQGGQQAGRHGRPEGRSCLPC
jgi:hypothetical protein